MFVNEKRTDVLLHLLTARNLLNGKISFSGNKTAQSKTALSHCNLLECLSFVPFCATSFLFLLMSLLDFCFSLTTNNYFSHKIIKQTTIVVALVKPSIKNVHLLLIFNVTSLQSRMFTKPPIKMSLGNLKVQLKTFKVISVLCKL